LPFHIFVYRPLALPKLYCLDMRFFATVATCVILAHGIPRSDEGACESDEALTREVSSSALMQTKGVITQMLHADSALLQTKGVITQILLAEENGDKEDVSEEEIVAGDVVSNKDGGEALVEASSNRTFPQPCDPQANEATRGLLQFLSLMSESKHFIFGQHNANFVGQDFVDWNGDMNRSDCEDSVGKFPGYVGVTGDKIVVRGAEWGLPYVRNAVHKGAIVEVGWHPANPVTGGNCYDTSGGDVSAVTKGGSHWTQFTQWLDVFADFFHQAEVPLVFRYFHEMTGAWFWWGSGTIRVCTRARVVVSWTR